MEPAPIVAIYIGRLLGGSECLRPDGPSTSRPTATREEFVMGFGGALYRRDNVGRPWAPPWWFSFVVLPIMVIASFYISQVTGWRGVASSSAEAVSWSEVSSEGIFLYVLLYLGFYFVLVLPIFLVRRHLWEKKQTQAAP